MTTDAQEATPSEKYPTLARIVDPANTTVGYQQPILIAEAGLCYRELSALRARLDAPCPDVRAQVTLVVDADEHEQGCVTHAFEAVPASLALDLRRKYDDAQYWRERHCHESGLRGEQSQENWTKWQAAERALEDSKLSRQYALESAKIAQQHLNARIRAEDELLAAQTALAEAKDAARMDQSAINALTEQSVSDQTQIAVNFDLFTAARSERDSAAADAERYRWLRDTSVPPHNFYLSVPIEFKDDRYTPQDVDAAIDAAIRARAAEKGGEK